MSIEASIPGIMAKVGSIERHCEMTRPNTSCPYIDFGCYGCSGDGPRTEERRERDRHGNKMLGLPPGADGIDRMAAAAGRTRDEQIAILDPVARSVTRLVAAGVERGVAERAVIALAESVGTQALGFYVDALCKLAQQGKVVAVDSHAGLGRQASTAELQVVMDSGDMWRFVSPRFVDPSTGAVVNIGPAKARRHGKRAQRKMNKPWKWRPQ